MQMMLFLFFKVRQRRKLYYKYAFAYSSMENDLLSKATYTFKRVRVQVVLIT